MKKVIITGANGFLGQWLIKELTTKDIRIIAVVRNEKAVIPLFRQLDNITIVVCPLEQIANLPSMIEEKDINVFYHFAWAGTSGDDRANVQMQLSNVQFTCDAVRAAATMGCTKFVYAGSIMEYEAMQNLPLDDVFPGMGNIYSTAKLTADFMAKTLSSNLKIQYITAIISNIYGVGEESPRLINTTIRKFLKGEKAQFTKGDQLYDFIYVTDAVKAFYLIGEHGKSNTSYYIGNQKPQSLKNFIVGMRDIVNKDLHLIFGEIPFIGASLNYNQLNTNKLYSEFGFEAEISFEQGIRTTMQWIKDSDLS